MARINLNLGAIEKQLQKHVKANGQNLVPNGQAIELSKQVLASEAARLAQCIQRQIDMYYASYSPSVYTRTGALKEAIETSPSVSVAADGKTLEASITLKTVPGESLFDGETVDQVAVIDQGWTVKQPVWFRDKYHFGRQSGFNFIDKGIADFLKSNPYNLTVTRS